MRYNVLGKTGLYVSELCLVDNLAATEVKLTAEQVSTLDEASKFPPEYPGWMVEFQNREPRVTR